MDLSQQVIDLSDLRNGLERIALAIQPPEVDRAGLANARKLFAELEPMFQALADGPLGVSDEDGKHQLSAENAKRLKRIGLDVKYVGMTCEGDLLDLHALEAEAKALSSVEKAKSKGVADARSRFGR